MADQAEQQPSIEHARTEAERYIKGVVLQSIQWYEKEGKKNNKLYNYTRILIVVLSLSLPAVLVWEKEVSCICLTVITYALPILVAILASFDGFFHWGELWRSRTSTEISLRRIKREFWADWNSLLLMPESEQVESAYSKYKSLVYRVEKLMVSEEKTFWEKRIQQLKGPKSDKT